MNERIYEMATEAAEHALLNPSEDSLQSEAEGYDTIVVPRQFIDKFAELLVQECCQKLEDEGCVEIAIELKQHFGIE